mgnify:FL=1
MDGVNFIKQAFSMNTAKTSGNTAKLGGNSFTDFMGKTSVQTKTDVKTDTDAAKTSGNEYSQYKYTDKNIQASDKTPDQMKMDDVSKSTGDMKDELISTVAEDLNVSEDDLITAMENLGMVWTDLLNQQNLADVAIELNVSVDSTELLLNSDFQNALMDVNQILTDAAVKLGMDVNEFTDLVAQMTLVELDEAAALNEVAGEALNSTVQTTEEAETADNGTVKADVVTKADAGQTKDNAYVVNENAVKSVDDDMDAAGSSQDFTGNSDSDGKQADTEGNNGILFAQDTAANVMAELNADDVNADYRPYMSTDTTELINQIVDNIRLNVSQDTTSIEMQLNPENLGRVYVHLSAKEGTVNAQFTATNEVVKEALEAQIVTLKENLNQAGVKVDAVEITVSSHEFERNLEQDQSREEQEGEYQEAAAKQRRRNINMSSLDELTGVMTEEESLVAQMMRDNGNSVDMTV